MRTRAILIRMAMVSALLAGAVATAQPAFAVGCQNNGCTSLWPVQQGCDIDAGRVRGVSWQTAYGPVVAQLIYSPNCNAAWVRGQSINTGEEHGETGDYKVKVVKRAGGDIVYTHVITVYGNLAHAWDWTRMAGLGTGSAKACVEWNGDWKCSDWYAPAPDIDINPFRAQAQQD